MLIANYNFEVIDWSSLEETKYEGDKGYALWKTTFLNDIRIRKVIYSAGYVSNHWCEKGHILHVLKGTLHTKVQSGKEYTLYEGQTYLVGDHSDPHLSSTEIETTLLIID